MPARVHHGGACLLQVAAELAGGPAPNRATALPCLLRGAPADAAASADTPAVPSVEADGETDDGFFGAWEEAEEAEEEAAPAKCAGRRQLASDWRSEARPPVCIGGATNRVATCGVM